MTFALLLGRDEESGRVGTSAILGAWEFDYLTILGNKSWKLNEKSFDSGMWSRELGVWQFLGLGSLESDSLTILGTGSWESNEKCFDSNPCFWVDCLGALYPIMYAT